MKIKIPEKVLFIYPEDVKQETEFYGIKESGTPAFPLDIDLKEKATYKNAISWAENYRLYSSNNINKRKVKELLVDNIPFNKLKVIGYENRTYSTVFKVLTEDGFLFDFNLSGIYYIMQKSIIDKCNIDCKFIWARLTTKTFIIPETAYDESIIQEIIQ